MLTTKNLVNICKTEKSIINSISCLDKNNLKSLIPYVFDMDSCDYLDSFSSSLYLFGLPENENFVEDNVSPSHPQSHIVISYFQVIIITLVLFVIIVLLLLPHLMHIISLDRAMIILFQIWKISLQLLLMQM